MMSLVSVHLALPYGADMIVQRSTMLKTSVETAWQALRLRDTFLFITRGALSYRGSQYWPEILMIPGTEILTRVRPLGFLPGVPHVVRVVSVDEPTHEICTKEYGNRIRKWNHTMHIEPLSDTRCRYSDLIDIDAGGLTPALWLLAHAFYGYRQYRWRTLAPQLNLEVESYL